MSGAATIENARISKTMLGFEDHGIFTFFVYLDGHQWGAGFGGFACDRYDRKRDRRVGSAFGIEAISAVLNALEVAKWEDLPGTPVRVETGGLGTGATRLGHFIKDQWVDLRALAEEHQEAMS